MSVKQKINSRMADAMAKSYFKPWYKRPWGIAIIVTLIIIFLLSLLFAFQIINSMKHLEKGEIFNPESGTWVTQDQFRNNQLFIANLMTEDDPWLGAEEPFIFVTAYESFGCPFCKEDQENIKQMLAKFGGIVRFMPKDFPTEGLHPGVMDAHMASACAHEQGGYWKYHDLLFENQGEFGEDQLRSYAKELSLDMDQFDTCVKEDKYDKEIRQDYAAGVQAGAIGTPSYVINGQVVSGSISYERWEEIIGYILKQY